MAPKETTLGVVVGNRGFFPDHLVGSGRKEILAVLAGAGLSVVCLSPDDTKFGAVETLDDAKKCAALFKRNADKIDGVLVTLPNFGDERGVADALRLAGLDVPVLIQAYPDDPAKMTLTDRRDSFCGKMSVCNNLTQYGIDYSLTRLHTVSPSSPSFADDLAWFAAVCRVVRGLRGARIGAIGARPAAFKTVRFSEKLLEASGIDVEVVDLSEILGKVAGLADDDPAVTARVDAVEGYVNACDAPRQALTKIAKLCIVVDDWCEANAIDATAFQCWTSIQENLGICSCTTMSMMSDRLMPSACEVDVMGAVAMYSLVLASGRPSALVDWNNNYGDDPDACVLFHCSNLPSSLLQDPKMSKQDILAATVGRENSWGTCVGLIKPGPMTYARLSTDDTEGEIVGYVGEGKFTAETVHSFGGYGVTRVPDLQGLLRFICRMGFEHHVAVNPSTVGRAIHEAWTNYLGWSIYQHG